MYIYIYSISQVQILDTALRANALGKEINPSLLSPAMGKIAG